MAENSAQQAFKELLPYLEALDTQSAAILQLLKDKGLTTDEQFTSYLEQAGNASNIKWLAARLRIDRLLSLIDKDKEEGKAEASPEAIPRQRSPNKDPERNQENAETEKAGGDNDDQTAGKNNPDSVNTKIETKRDMEKEGEQPSKDTKPPDNQSEKDSDGRAKESGSNTNADRSGDRDPEKKAS